MVAELIYASAAVGLEGNTGFGWVACTRGLSQELRDTLRSLSTLESDVDGPRVGAPSLCHSVLSVRAEKTVSVLSRVGYIGADGDGRGCTLAHHYVLAAEDVHACDPARMLLAFDRGGHFRSRAWNEAPRWLEPRRLSDLLGPQTALPARTWCKAAGDQGWAGALPRAFRAKRLAILIHDGKTDLLALFAESLAVLPAEDWWQVRFATRLPRARWAEYDWVAVPVSSRAQAESYRAAGAVVIDLARSLGKPQEDDYTEAARAGVEVELPPFDLSSAQVPSPLVDAVPVPAPKRPRRTLRRRRPLQHSSWPRRLGLSLVFFLAAAPTAVLWVSWRQAESSLAAAKAETIDWKQKFRSQSVEAEGLRRELDEIKPKRNRIAPPVSRTTPEVKTPDAKVPETQAPTPAPIASRPPAKSVVSQPASPPTPPPVATKPSAGSTGPPEIITGTPTSEGWRFQLPESESIEKLLSPEHDGLSDNVILDRREKSAAWKVRGKSDSFIELVRVEPDSNNRAVIWTLRQDRQAYDRELSALVLDVLASSGRKFRCAVARASKRLTFTVAIDAKGSLKDPEPQSVDYPWPKSLRLREAESYTSLGEDTPLDLTSDGVQVSLRRKTGSAGLELSCKAALLPPADKIESFLQDQEKCKKQLEETRRELAEARRPFTVEHEQIADLEEKRASAAADQRLQPQDDIEKRKEELEQKEKALTASVAHLEKEKKQRKILTDDEQHKLSESKQYASDESRRKRNELPENLKRLQSDQRTLAEGVKKAVSAIESAQRQLESSTSLYLVDAWEREVAIVTVKLVSELNASGQLPASSHE
jgi:hypothetical protein